jgi:hypothetical protein
MTLIELIKQSLGAIGVCSPGDVLSADRCQTAIDALNILADSANVEVIYSSTRESKVLTIGTSTYTWGTGGTINTARPIKLLNAFIRDGNDDYPIEQISQYEYDAITDKTETGRPFCLYVNPTYPLTTLYFYYVPDAAYTLFLDSEKDLINFDIATLTSTIALPGEYLSYFKWNLAEVSCPAYLKDVPPLVTKEADRSRRIVRRLIASDKLKPIKQNLFPTSMPGVFYKIYDIKGGTPL